MSSERSHRLCETFYFINVEFSKPDFCSATRLKRQLRNIKAKAKLISIDFHFFDLLS